MNCHRIGIYNEPIKHLCLRKSGHLVADLCLESKPTQLILSSGQSYDAVLTYADDQKQSIVQTLVIPPEAVAGSLLRIGN